MASFAHWADVLKGQEDVRTQAWNKVLSKEQVEAACRREKYSWRDRFWVPLRVLQTFLIQVLHTACSCGDAVAMTLADLAASGQDVHRVSSDPSAYAGARKRLPENVVRWVFRTIGQCLRDWAADGHKFCGRRVWMVDGTTCSMPDTPSLQEAFGQPSSQKPGCGFPVARIVGLFCWASGAVVDVAIGQYRKSELALWRTLWGCLGPGDIALADRYYCNYADIVGLQRQKADVVFRLHQRRKADFRRGKRLSKDDRLMTWQRPVKSARPRGMSVDEWERLPETLTVRILRAAVGTRGFRCRSVVIATTLLDPVEFPAEKIVALYGDRWTIELRLRDLKTMLGMDVLRGKSPGVVRKEIYMHLAAYNMVRMLMWQAAEQYGQDLHRMSFAGAVDRLNAIWPYLLLLAGTERAATLYDLVLRWIAENKLPHRPNRVEPRAVKRRPKEYARLNRPRHKMREALMR